MRSRANTFHEKTKTESKQVETKAPPTPRQREDQAIEFIKNTEDEFLAKMPFGNKEQQEIEKNTLFTPH